MINISQAIELGRDAVPLLEDYSSQMPWNISASKHGSRQSSLARGRGIVSSMGGFPTSVGGPSSLPHVPEAVIPSSFDRRASRITSASPLLGRGIQRSGSLELPTHDDGDLFLGGRGLSDDQALDDFQLYGPAAAVDTQTAAQSQWVKNTLDQESTNFLDFVKAKIASRLGISEDDDNDELDEGAESRTSVGFEELLPLTDNSKIVAAQAFHHVLALATKGLIGVKQEVAYGMIRMEVSGTL